MDFLAYLKSKKIDPEKFREADQEKFNELNVIFDQMHPESFTTQKLFLINPLRRKYKWAGEEEKVESKLKPMKPRISKPKIWHVYILTKETTEWNKGN